MVLDTTSRGTDGGTEPTLAALIEDARAMYESDLQIPALVAHSPPTTRDPRTGKLTEELAAALGMTLSGRLLRYLGHPEGYGDAHPWLRSLFYLGVECWRGHLGHAERPAWRGSLCRQLVRMTVIHQVSIPSTVMVLELDVGRASRALTTGLRWIEADIDAWREAAEERERRERDHQASENLLDLFAREHDEATEQRFWEALRAKHPDILAPWAVERERRRAFHLEKGCPLCAAAA